MSIEIIPKDSSRKSEVGILDQETVFSTSAVNNANPDKTTAGTDVIVNSSSDITELERYLSGILNGLQKQQETQKNEVLQLILQQHQELQGEQNQQPQLQSHSMSLNSMASLPHSTAWTFTQGLILGQLSVIILFIAFIRFFVFTEAAPTQASSIPSKSNVSIIKAKKGDDMDLSRLQGGFSKDHEKEVASSIPKVNGLTDDLSHQKEINQALGSGHIKLDSNSTLISILEKTYYDVKTHKPESLDWFNVLVAQIISQARLEALNDGNIYESLNKALNSPQVLQYFDRIKISEINIGDDYPIFSNCRVKNNEGRLEAKIDVDVSDTITLGVETNLLINQPKFMSASLPIKLSISVVRFSACLTVSLITVDDDYANPSNDKNHMTSSTDDIRASFTEFKSNDTPDISGAHQDTNSGSESTPAFVDNHENREAGSFFNSPETNTNPDNRATNNEGSSIPNGDEASSESSHYSEGGHSIALMFSFSPDFRLEFETKSLIGSRAKLENIPRVSSILENVIRKWFIERCIEPRFQLIKLPSMWPRKKNTRESVPSE
ncbi:hypothetical protein PICMEDRAFT_15061 [Pichia membranifaciens NRRL Y-2026]|uniref:Maintenance of mitochondrial morphology protein 1 n=1 Tax=Pichia membranifaciens NRRL Y-2026 TaxID=763406 RepID=A0A1E3NLQ7_9ASCO|nr:hypothetical protein PICMEDRAFT_15061 [Pichia membranifaciens NRRL Y-2026]ODQ47061.1 hypothetical protein PICMEDRAFT_15061 [Pichia membranifaciens NRRL Y-2026]